MGAIAIITVERFIFIGLFLLTVSPPNGFNGGILGVHGSPVETETELGNSTLPVSVNDDGDCVSPTPAQMDIVWAIGFSKRAKYIPMGSQLYYANTAKLLTGEPLGSWADLGGMCLEAKSDTSNGGSRISGFGHEVQMICEIEWIGKFKCCAKVDRNMEDCDNSTEITRVVATWTDNKDYLLTVSCQPDGHKVWNVVSTKKYMERDAKEAILEHVQQYNFDPNNAIELNYETC